MDFPLSKKPSKLTGKTIRENLAFKNKGYLFLLHSNPESNANTLVKFKLKEAGINI